LVSTGTFGGAIPTIEPIHLKDIPIPRLGNDLEARVDGLIQESATAFSSIQQHLTEASVLLAQKLHLSTLSPWNDYARPLIVVERASRLQDRLDAFFFCEPNREAEQAFCSARNASRTRLGDLAEVFIPGFFKRLFVDDPKYGYPYLKGAEVYDLQPQFERYLAKKVADDNRLVVQDGMILIQDSGQLNGIIGLSVLVGNWISGYACTNNMVRIVPRDRLDGGYLFAVLSSEFGTRLLKRSASGSSIPHLEEERIKGLQIPWASDSIRREVGGLVLKAKELREEGVRLELKARRLVEQAIEAGGA
jgi:type I restriction enzyme S subunit